MKKIIIIIMLLCMPLMHQPNSKELNIYGTWTGDSIKATDLLLSVKKEKRKEIINKIYYNNKKP